MSAERYFKNRKEIGQGFFNGREQYDQLIDRIKATSCSMAATSTGLWMVKSVCQ